MPKAHYKRAEEKLFPHQDYEDWASGGKVAMGRHATGLSYKSKNLNENLSPLRNFLRKSVGKKWDDVFAEISKACPHDSAVNAHIYQHLFQYVEINPIFGDDGVVYRAAHKHTRHFYGGTTEAHQRIKNILTSHGRDYQFYVDQKGFLKAAPEYNKLLREAKGNLKVERTHFERKIDDSRWAVRMNGVWFWAILEDLPPLVKTISTMTHHDGSITNHDVWTAPYVKDAYHSHEHYPYKKDGTLGHMEYFRIHDNPSMPPHRQWDDVRSRFTRYYGVPKYCAYVRQMNSLDIRHYLSKST